MKYPKSIQRLQESDTACEEMIVSALPLVAMLAKQMAQRLPPSVTVDELISAGTFGEQIAAIYRAMRR